MERRTFIRYVGTLGTMALVMPELMACDRNGNILINRIGADFQRGHLLRNVSALQQKPVTKELNVPVLIVGGGISGLSTAYHLKQQGPTDFLLLEMNREPGGNSGSSANRHSAFPLGAHYLSLANPKNQPMIDFLIKLGLIEGIENGKYIYNERHLCHAPDERLLYRGVFSEGLVPEYGISAQTHEEITRFFELMKDYRNRLDENGNDLFHIPLSYSGHSELLGRLDQQTFAAFLKEEGFHSEELTWFLDYCCRDDYGAGLDTVSAWAGLHYFAGRKAQPANTDPVSVLTWPEGNGFLTNQLRKPIEDNIRTDMLVHSVEEQENQVIVHAFDVAADSNIRITADQVVMASPSYVNAHVLRSPQWPQEFFRDQVHHPWLVGIVVLDKLPATEGTPLAWDNVKFGTKGLGYVNNRHQELNRHFEGQHVISVYYALDKQGDKEERRALFSKSDDELLAIITGELESMHPEITKAIASVTFQLWGHGMITPVPGTYKKQRVFRELNAKAKRVHLAHTDFSGYSVFEEAFDLGFHTAAKLMQHEA